jgi:hypothetical protein
VQLTPALLLSFPKFFSQLKWFGFYCGQCDSSLCPFLFEPFARIVGSLA